MRYESKAIMMIYKTENPEDAKIFEERFSEYLKNHGIKERPNKYTDDKGHIVIEAQGKLITAMYKFILSEIN